MILTTLFLLFLITIQPPDTPPAAIPVHENMALIPGGTFQMGDLFNEGSNDEKPVHTVTVDSFYLSKTELTFIEYDAFCKATGREKPSDKGWGRGRRPVINVDWYDAVEYCNWLSAKENLLPVYTIDKTRQDPDNQSSNDEKKWMVTIDRSARGYRLPTEAEWEYAAREGGKKVRFGHGRDTIAPFEANFNCSDYYKTSYSVAGECEEQKTVHVDEMGANSFGLKHMTGNVWEWCQDWYDGMYYRQSHNAHNPMGPAKGAY
ncbi:MAG TPA: SUMF1/EgtB/PvdO family nonheme iron enzyme, partial [Saprospiraceae bacterium]|nr:SUMF1/EgtB/PvdO family nonheme iron enzyme [Saprospiraceae bacterium]